jgi:low temperature requirement protein LtrA
MRGDTERVTPLELFFDLVFVLAITQCTTLMSHHTTWEGIGQALIVLGLLWWAWVGYAWLTSVVDPEEGAVRLTIFAAIAALLVAALCLPTAFGSSAGTFVAAYAIVRVAHIVLFMLASREDPMLRRSVLGLAAGTALGIVLLAIGAVLGVHGQEALWVAALVLDGAGPYFFGAEGWRLVPHHFAERHGLIVLIALGESIVAIGVSAQAGVSLGTVAAAVAGVVVAAALFWLYFDVVALVAVRRLENAHEGRERNSVARDSFSYLHFPMVAGIVLVALGVKKTLAHQGDALEVVAATALLGGAALYLLAHVAFRWRNVHRFSGQRVIAAAVCLALIVVATRQPALLSLALLGAVLSALVVYESLRFAELRARLRRQLDHATG